MKEKTVKPVLKLYNTLSKKVEEFKSIIPYEVRMYSCGPTVYSYAHIGNFRAYVFMDILKRVLKYNGYNIKSVMNITDVGHLISDQDTGEDKMELAAKKEQKTPYEIAEQYTKAFFDDAKKLNIDFKDVIIAKATDHIKEMAEFIKGIERNGYAYVVDGNVYFDVNKYNKDFSNKYGELSGLNLDEQMAGARIEVNADKRSPYDFALWIKAPKEHIMQWNSPWGVGYPGWHIECSAMSTKYLGQCFDIHTGGVDHIPVHHENEIAQSRGLTCDKEHTQANFWMHCEFLKVDNGKMSKSLGNVYTISDLEKRGFSALDYRYFLLNANFRNPQNFTWEGLESAHYAFLKLKSKLAEHTGDVDDKTLTFDELNSYKEEFDSAVNNDLNIPLALGILWDMIKTLPKSKRVFDMAIEMDKIFGLNLNQVSLDPMSHSDGEIIVQNNIKFIYYSLVSSNIKRLVEQRHLAKQNKNFAESDRIRNELKNLGYTVKDSKDSYEIKKD